MAANANHDGVWNGLGHQFSAGNDDIHYPTFAWQDTPLFDADEPPSSIEQFVAHFSFLPQSPLEYGYDDAQFGFSLLGLSEDERSVIQQEDEHAESIPLFLPFDMPPVPVQPAARIPDEAQQPEKTGTHGPSIDAQLGKKKRCFCVRRSPKQAPTSNKEKRAPNPRYQCPRCRFGGTDTRSLRRHIWAEHEDYAEQNKIPTEKEQCKFPGCKYWARKDNVLRHWRKKHCNGGGK